jgi:hypothetical protein
MTFWLARLAGFEPATGCLEDMPWLYGDVRDLGLPVVAVHEVAAVAQLVGVECGCQRAWPPNSSMWWTGPRLVQGLRTGWSGRRPPALTVGWFGACPQDLSDFDIPAHVAGRLWCPLGAFSGANQGRHVNHLLVDLLTWPRTCAGYQAV